MINLSIESLNAPFDAVHYKEIYESESERGRTLLKVGVMSLICFEGEILGLEHIARDGQWEEDALGTSQETARFAKDPVTGAKVLETPMQAWQRSLTEELGMDNDDIVEAGFFFSKGSVFYEGEWVLGRIGDHKEAFYSGMTMSVGVTEPDVIFRAFRRSGGRNEEISGVKLITVEDALAERNIRPGYTGWLEGVVERTGDLSEFKPVVPVLPVSSFGTYYEDLRFAV